MRKRVQIVSAVLLVVFAGVFGWERLRQREPAYQGEPLTYWLWQYANHFYAWSGPGYEWHKQRAETAIRHIGTNAIPNYLEMIAATPEQPMIKLKLMGLVPKRWLVRMHLRSASDYRLLGAFGLIALGADAKPAVPSLAALLNDRNPDVRYAADFALRSLGPVATDAVPSRIRFLEEPDFAVQSDTGRK